MFCEIKLEKLKYPKVFLSDLDVIPSLQIGDFLFKFELDPPSPEVQEIARKELRETPELQKEAISQLQELLRAETDLYCPLDNESWLLRFLRRCKYYPESACLLVKNYYRFKARHPSIYKNLIPSNERNVFEQKIINVLPNRDQCGRRILILEVGKSWEINKCTLDEIFRGCILQMEASMFESITQIQGAIIIFDLKGFTTQHVMQLTLSFAKRLVDFIQEAVPLRIKNVHVVNEPYIINMVMKIIKPMLKEKLKSRVICHGTDRRSLHKYISPNCLPPSYGGTSPIPRVTGLQWYEMLCVGNKEYEKINSYGYNKK